MLTYPSRCKTCFGSEDADTSPVYNKNFNYEIRIMHQRLEHTEGGERSRLVSV